MRTHAENIATLVEVTAPSRLASAMGGLFRRLTNRRTATVVNALGDHMLNDIGLNRESIRWAEREPFHFDSSGALYRLEPHRRQTRGRRTA